jgi:hypothetical protein
MAMRLSDSWWVARIAPHPAPATLVTQTRLAIALYLIMISLPSLADLLLNEGSYNVLYPSYAIPSTCISIGFLLLTWYLVNVEGGAWQIFWNSKFVPNVACMILTATALTVTQLCFHPIFNEVVKKWPALAPYRAAEFLAFKDSLMLMLPMTFFAILCQEIMARGFLITRIRQVGGGLAQAVLWSILLYSTSSFGWGIDVFCGALVSGLALSLIYARWGGLAGIILGRMAWECSNYLNVKL